MDRIVRSPKHWVYILCHLVLILGGFLLCQCTPTTIWFAIGSSLIAAGIAGWVIFAYVLLTENVSDKLNALSEFGLIAVFDARSVRIRHEYDKRLAAAQEKIDIIGFGLSAFREDFLNEFPRWKQRANVRVLLLDPDFPSAEFSYAKQRDTEEKNSAEKIADDVRKFVDDVGPLIGKSGGHSFEIKFYQCLPTLNIFRIDDELFWGPYLVQEQSRNTPTFLIKRGILFDRFAAQFERIWKDFSKSIPKSR